MANGDRQHEALGKKKQGMKAYNEKTIELHHFWGYLYMP